MKKKMFIISLIPCLILPSIASISCSEKYQGGMIAKMDKFLNSLINNAYTSGLSVKITKNNKEVYKINAGMQSIKNPVIKQVVNDNTLYKAFSMTKPLTTIAFLNLLDLFNDSNCSIVDDFSQNSLSKITPKTEVKSFFKEWDSQNLRTTSDEKVNSEITLENLMTMTSGIQYFSLDVLKTLLPWRFGGSEKTMDNFARTLSKVPLSCQPSTDWNYGLNIDLLGCIGNKIIEELQKSDHNILNFKYSNWGDYVQGMIDDIGMKNSFYGRKMPKSRIKDIMDPVETKDGVVKDASNSLMVMMVNLLGWQKPLDEDQDCPMGGNTLITSLDDYSMLQNFLVTGKNILGEQIVKKSTLENMRTPHISNEVAKNAKMLREGFSYGYGVRVKVDDSIQFRNLNNGTFGWDGMLSTMSLMDPKNDICICLMTQKSVSLIGGEDTGPQIDQIYNKLFEFANKL